MECCIKEMIKDIYDKCITLSIEEMANFVRSEIGQYPLEGYKNMDLEMKIYLHKLYSYLYFIKECDNRNCILKCMRDMTDTKGFYDRTQLVVKYEKSI